MKSLRLLLTSSLLTAALAAGAQADEVDEVVKQISAQFAKVDSIQASVREHQETAAGRKQVAFDSDGTYEMLRDAGKLKSREELKRKLSIDASQRDAGLENVSLSINDGEFVYTLVRSLGTPLVHKRRPDPLHSPDAAVVVAALREKYTLQKLPDAKVDDADCCAIETTLKAPPAKKTAPVTFRYYYRKDNGVLAKWASLDAGGRELRTRTFTDIKLNEKLDPQRFAFVAPPGVHVIDRTNAPSEP